jgi:hypothetical protein
MSSSCALVAGADEVEAAGSVMAIADAADATATVPPVAAAINLERFDWTNADIENLRAISNQSFDSSLA